MTIKLEPAQINTLKMADDGQAIGIRQSIALKDLRLLKTGRTERPGFVHAWLTDEGLRVLRQYTGE